MRSIRFSDQVHHSGENGDNYYRASSSLGTPNVAEYDGTDDFVANRNRENDFLLNDFHSRNFGRAHRKVRKERSFDSLPLSEYGAQGDGYGRSAVNSLPRHLKTSKSTNYFSPGVRAAQQVSAAAAYHLNRPSSALPNRSSPRPKYLDGPVDEVGLNYQNTEEDPYYAMQEGAMQSEGGGRHLNGSTSYLTVPSVNVTQTNLDDEYLDDYNYDDKKPSSQLYRQEGRGSIQGSNYSSSSPRSALSGESMGGGNGNFGRQPGTGILRKESILKNSYNSNFDSTRRTSGSSHYKLRYVLL